MPNIIETVDRLKRELDDLRPLPPDVIARIEQKPNKAGFSHYRPARYFSDQISSFEKELDESTLDRFRKMLETLNALLKES